MSKRLGLIIAVLYISAIFSACGSAGLSGESSSPAPSASPTASAPIASAKPEATPVAAVSDESLKLEEAYRSFISDNYDELSAACFGGIAGVGFIDLDLDGSIEMLLFDAGASASMGIQFFDMIDGSIECVSANMLPMGERFGGKHFSKTVVNANYFDDFRLMENHATGERYFQVISFNGAADFSYRELIVFGSDKGSLTLTPVFYTYENYDLDSGEVLGTEYKVSGKVCTESEYAAAMESRSAENSDLGLEIKGVFMWEKAEYTADKAGLLSMVNAALLLSRSNRL